MQRRTEQLDPRRRQKLRRRVGKPPAPVAAAHHALRQLGRDERRQIERREDGERVPQREEGVAGARDARGGGGGRAAGPAEQLGEAAVLVEAEGHVDGGGGEEFGGAGGHGGGGDVVVVGGDGAAGGVDGVCGGVGAEVEAGDE